MICVFAGKPFTRALRHPSPSAKSQHLFFLYRPTPYLYFSLSYHLLLYMSFSLCASIYLSVCLFVYQYICLHPFPSVCTVCLSVIVWSSIYPSGGSRIYKRGGGIKYWICCLYNHAFIKLPKPQGGNSASPKRPFF